MKILFKKERKKKVEDIMTGKKTINKGANENGYTLYMGQ